MKTKKIDLVKVVATRAQAVDYYATGYYLPNPDPVLKKMGKDITAYREVLADSHVSGCVRRRKAAVKGLEWRITPTGNEKVDEQLTLIFNTLPLNQIITQILNATLFGYQALEVMWQEVDSHLFPVDIQAKPQEWFVFDEDNQLKLRTKEHQYGKALSPYKFLLATQDATYDNPYGQGDLAKCFWAATFKKGGFKFWLEFAEKYGSPWLIGKHPRQASTLEAEELLDSLEQMMGNAVAVIPNDSSITIEESGSKGASSQVFDDFLRYCKSEISVAILGQDQTTEADSNRASAASGLEVLKEIRNDDVRLVEGVFNQLLQWIIELNFTVEQLPKFELFEQESIDKRQAERDEILSRCGVKFSEQYLKRIYDFEDGDIVVQATKPTTEKSQSAVNFAENLSEPKLPANIADGIIEQLEIEGEPYVENWLQQVQDKLLQADNLEEFRTQLDSLIPELDFTEYGELLALASTVAELSGQQAVENERKRAKKRGE